MNLRDAIDAQTFELWLAALRPARLDEQRLVLTAPDTLRAWVADRFGELLQEAVRAVLGPGGAVEVVAAAEAGDRLPRPHHPSPRDGGPEPLHPKLVFEQFVIGSSNHFAHAAALAVAELPGQTYNPLFIYGPPGVGKTHLLHSVGNYVRAYGDGLTVRATTAERFTTEFVAAARGGDMPGFRGRFRHTDVLLVDDVQFLESKARTEEEFFHTFNSLHDAGAQLVLTSDRLPRDLEALEDRLRERFEAGLVTDIGAPDEAVRLAVLRKRVQHDAIELPDESVLEVISERVTHNVRALEAALVRVVAFHSLTGRPLVATLAEDVLDGLFPETRREPTQPSVAHIQRVTCAEFGLSPEELVSRGRAPRTAWPRQVAMYLARELTEASLPAIGQSFGGRDHTTVLRAWRRVGERIDTDTGAHDAVRDLTARLREGG